MTVFSLNEGRGVRVLRAEPVPGSWRPRQGAGCQADPKSPNGEVVASRTRDITPTYYERRYLHRVDRSGLRVLDVRAALDELTPEQFAELLWLDEPAASARTSSIG